MKKLLIILMFFSGTVLFTSCNSKHQNKETDEYTQSSHEVLSVDNLLEKANSLVDETVRVEGVCTHICKHGGRKIFLMGSDDNQTIRVESTEKTGAFSQDCVNSVVTVTGKLVEERIDEAYLSKWEAEVKAKSDENHGKSGSSGCETKQKAQKEEAANTVEDRIENFRKRIAEEQEKTGKDYLSFYHIDAESYIIKE